MRSSIWAWFSEIKDGVLSIFGDTTSNRILLFAWRNISCYFRTRRKVFWETFLTLFCLEKMKTSTNDIWKKICGARRVNFTVHWKDWTGYGRVRRPMMRNVSTHQVVETLCCTSYYCKVQRTTFGLWNNSILRKKVGLKHLKTVQLAVGE